MKKIKELFLGFWQNGQAREALASYRIIYGVLIIVNLLILIPDFSSFFTETGVLNLAESRSWAGYVFFNLFRFDFINAGNSDLFAIILAVIWFVSGIAITLGYKFRFFAILNFIIIASFHQRNLLILHSGDLLLRVMGFYLIFAPANRIWSLDNYFKRQKNEPWKGFPFGEMWPLRLMQIQMSLLYISTYLYKTLGNLWLEGTAVYYTSRLESFYRFNIPFIFDQIWLIKLMTWGTLIVEGALGFLIWIPMLRPWVILAGIGLHLGIEITMNIPMFQWIMMASYLLFLPDGFWPQIWLKIQKCLGRGESRSS